MLKSSLQKSHLLKNIVSNEMEFFTLKKFYINVKTLAQFAAKLTTSITQKTSDNN